MSSSDNMVQIEIPPDVTPGSKLNIPLDDGRIFEVIVPNNVVPGDVINVVIPERDPTDTTTQNTTVSGNKISLGAAAAGAIVGTLVLGPVTGVILAGAALYASTRDDKVGDIARGAGLATVKVYDKAAEADEKYGITDRLKSAGRASMQKAKEIDEEYKIVDKAKETIGQLSSQAKALDEKYDISNKTAKAISSGISTLATAMSSTLAERKSQNTVEDSRK